MQKLGCSEKQARKLIGQVGKNGSISYNEFKKMMTTSDYKALKSRSDVYPQIASIVREWEKSSVEIQVKKELTLVLRRPKGMRLTHVVPAFGFNLQRVAGKIVITSVDSKSSAEEAGIRPLQLLIAVGDNSTENMTKMMAERLLSAQAQNEAITLTVGFIPTSAVYMDSLVSLKDVRFTAIDRYSTWVSEDMGTQISGISNNSLVDTPVRPDSPLSS